MSANHIAEKGQVEFNTLHPVGTDLYRYPHFQSQQEFALNGGLKFSNHLHVNNSFLCQSLYLFIESEALVMTGVVVVVVV